MLSGFVIAGFETTTTMLSLGIVTLLQYPQQLKLLKSDWSLLDNTVEEILRFCGTFGGKVRTCGENIQLPSGSTLKKGDTVSISIWNANTDESVFKVREERLTFFFFSLIFHSKNAREFDITKKRRCEHHTFSQGPHKCIGRDLARLEMRIALKSIFTRFPKLRLDPSAPPQFWNVGSFARGLSEAYLLTHLKKKKR